MSLEILPPFPIPERGAGRPPTAAEMAPLRDVVAGRDTSYSRLRAIARLAETGWTGAARDLGAVLADGSQPPDARVAAAVALARLGTADAVAELTAAAATRTPRVAAAVALALGRTGDAAALETIDALRRPLDGALRARGDFARALLQHRLGLDGEALALPGAEPQRPDERTAQPLGFEPADAGAAEAARQALGPAPYGVETAASPVYRVVCLSRPLLLFFDRRLLSGAALLRRKAIPALLAGRAAMPPRTSVAYLLLTEPDGSRALRGALYRPTGAAVATLSGRPAADGLRFHLQGLRGAGSFPLEVLGTSNEGRLTLERSEVAAQERLVLRPRGSD